MRRDRHLDWLVRLAERAEAGLWGLAQVGWLERLEVEHDNVRAALEWSRASGQGEAMLRLAAALARFWDVRGFLSEGYGWLAAALEATAPLRFRPRAQALARAGYLAVLRNDLPAAQAHLAQALELADELKDEETSGAALVVMGMVARAHGDYPHAALRFEESLVVARRVGHRPGIYTSLYLLASAVRFSGNYQRAVAACMALMQTCVAFQPLIGTWSSARRWLMGATGALILVALMSPTLGYAQQTMNAPALTPDGIALTAAELGPEWSLASTIHLRPDAFHGDWNYSLLPRIGLL